MIAASATGSVGTLHNLTESILSPFNFKACSFTTKTNGIHQNSPQAPLRAWQNTVEQTGLLPLDQLELTRLHDSTEQTGLLPLD